LRRAGGSGDQITDKYNADSAYASDVDDDVMVVQALMVAGKIRVKTTLVVRSSFTTETNTFKLVWCCPGEKAVERAIPRCVLSS
jgi:hypothetical protein